VGYSPRDSVFDYLQRLPSQPGYVPELVFIDRKRVIQGQFSGDGPMFQNQDKSIREELDKLLKQPAVSKKNGRPAHKKPS
jgi:hypothetical protein